MGEKNDVDDDSLNLSAYFDLLQNEYNLLSNLKINTSIEEANFQQYNNAFRSTISSYYQYFSERRNQDFNYEAGTLTQFHCILVSHILIDTMQIFKIEMCNIKNHTSPPTGLFEWRLVAFQKRINKRSCLDLILFMKEGVTNALRAKQKIDLQTIDNLLAATLYELMQNSGYGILEEKNIEINLLKNYIFNSEICYKYIRYSKMEYNNLFPFDEEMNAIQKLKQSIDGEYTDTLLVCQAEKRYVLKLNEAKHNQCTHHLNDEKNKEKKIISDCHKNKSAESCVTNEISNYYHFKISKLITEADSINYKYDIENEDLDLKIGNMRIKLENMKYQYAKQQNDYNIIHDRINWELLRRYRNKLAKKYFILWRSIIKYRKLYRIYNGDENLVHEYLLCELNGLPLPILPQSKKKNVKKGLKLKSKKK